MRCTKYHCADENQVVSHWILRVLKPCDKKHTRLLRWDLNPHHPVFLCLRLNHSTTKLAGVGWLVLYESEVAASTAKFIRIGEKLKTAIAVGHFQGTSMYMYKGTHALS